jgi:tricorn protease-like protein
MEGVAMKTMYCLLAVSMMAGTLMGAESAGPTLAQGQARLLRQPSYSKGKIAFSYLGDIWIVSENGSELHRLTDHSARDMMPRFSPDGKLIAFSSNRDGNHNVYVVPASGGKPRQLTFQSAEDVVVGWKPDGRRILSARRATKEFSRVSARFSKSPWMAGWRSL